jgi:hypothetical protein
LSGTGPVGDDIGLARQPQTAPLETEALERALTAAGDTMPRRQSRRRHVLEGRGWTWTSVGSDALMLVLAVVAALVGADAAGVDANSASVWLFPPLVIALLALRGMYRPKIRVQVIDEAGQVIAASSVAAMLIIAASAFVTDAGAHA